MTVQEMRCCIESLSKKLDSFDRILHEKFLLHEALSDEEIKKCVKFKKNIDKFISENSFILSTKRTDKIIKNEKKS